MRAQKKEMGFFLKKSFLISSIHNTTWSYLKRLVNVSSSCLSCERIDFKCSVIWSILCSKTLSRSLLTFCQRSSLLARM